MFREIFLFIGILFIVFATEAKNPNAAPIEHISVKMFATGDLHEEYDFNGPLGALIVGNSYTSSPVCKFSALFRKVKYRAKISIEAWLKLDCTFEGHKSTYKASRIYLNLDKEPQKIKLPMLAKNLKNVLLEFQELSLKLSR